jgi:Leucine-rich repeat (LRR) protein
VCCFVVAAPTLRARLLLLQELNNLGMLVSLTSLVRLNVSFNCLTQLNCIRALQQLQSLNISHNRLTTSGIEGLSSLRGLTQLICSHNRISSTEALVQLPDLQFLALHSNSINTAGDVLALSSLTKLQHITLGKNPVCKQENWEDGVIALLPGLQVSSSKCNLTSLQSLAQQWLPADPPAGPPEC